MGRLAAAGLLMLAASGWPLHAEEFPWCVELDAFTKNCAFAKYEECTAVAANAAGPATGQPRCVRNPAYQAAAKSGKPAAAKSSPKPR